MSDLAVADRYFDAAPRSDCTPEEVGPFTLFRSRSVWPYYARPRLDGAGPFDALDVERLMVRCSELELKPAIEWIGERTPTLETAAEAVHLQIERHALLVLAPGDLWAAAPPDGVRIDLLPAEDPRLVTARGVAEVSFTAGGTDVGAEGAAERDARTAETTDAMRAHLRRRTELGLTLTSVAVDPAQGVIATGSLHPVGDAAEIVAVATLPSERRRGLAAAISSALVGEARRRGMTLVLISAQSDAVARVYERVGFRRIGTHLAAEPLGH